MKYYTVDLDGFEAKLPILQLPSGVGIAFFNLHGDSELSCEIHIHGILPLFLFVE